MLLQYQSAQVVEDEHLSEHIVSEQCFSDLDALQDFTDRDAATDANSSLVRPEIVILRDPQEAEAEAARQQQALPLPLP